VIRAGSASSVSRFLNHVEARLVDVTDRPHLAGEPIYCSSMSSRSRRMFSSARRKRVELAFQVVHLHGFFPAGPKALPWLAPCAGRGCSRSWRRHEIASVAVRA
jgi:hypothetical protein